MLQVLRALRRLKGNSNNRKEKMTSETKLIFDQLTEDADKLIENGDYSKSLITYATSTTNMMSSIC